MSWNNDGDHPAEASPWGSPGSSPRNTRTFSSLNADAPPQSPFPGIGSQPGSNGFGSQEQDDSGFGGGAQEYQRPFTASTTSGAETEDTAVEPGTTGQPAGGYDGRQSQPGQEAPIAAGDRSDPASTGAEAQNRRPPQQLKLQAKITGLERSGRKDPVLRFDVHTKLPRFRTTQYRDVRRLHSEFEKLAEHLISANPDAIVPAVPPSVTSAGAGTEEDENRVKALMQRWFNCICSNEVLMRDDEMILFVESDFGYSPMTKRKQHATGVKRKVLKQFAPPPDDTPELANARPVVKQFFLNSLTSAQKVERLTGARRGLGLAENDFGTKLGAMSIQEPHSGLANAYRKLGKAIQTTGDCHAAQATAEATTIGDPLFYHSKDAEIVKETLTNRQLLIRDFLQAQETSRSKLHAADRIKSSSNVRREKVDEAISSLEDARQNETFLYQKTTRVTQNLVHEHRAWAARTAQDLRLSIKEYALREIEAERRILSLLETVRPDIRSIDGSGGLSRLGRESHPAQRRSSLASSQGPKGDAWSGVPRRSEAMGRSGIMGGVPEEGDEAEQIGEGEGQGRSRALSSAADEDDEDRIDARNAASRLATSTFF